MGRSKTPSPCDIYGSLKYNVLDVWEGFRKKSAKLLPEANRGFYGRRQTKILVGCINFVACRPSVGVVGATIFEEAGKVPYGKRGLLFFTLCF